MALFLGLIFSYFANNDNIHKYLRKISITNESSFPSEWFGIFKKDQKTHIVLHLHDARRLYGWPREWPSDPTSGYFVIAYPSWLVDEGELPITGVEDILISANDVKWVEFVANKLESKNA